MSDKNNDSDYKCQFITNCPFMKHNEKEMPGLVSRLKEEYCLRDNTHCARKLVRDILGPESVPPLMMPNQNEWARQLLGDDISSKVHQRK